MKNGVQKPWKKIKLKILFKVYGGTTPSTLEKRFWNGEIPWAIPTDITKKKNNMFLTDTDKKITEEAVKRCGLKIIPPNAVLLTSRATIGFACVNKIPVTINQGITALIPKDKEKTVSLFYAYYFSSLKTYLEQLAGGSTFKEVSRETLKNLLIPLPPLPEQRKIAEILGNVDEAIEKVEKIIEKTERIKKGLMRELLTRGTGHKEFKRTEIGTIPKEWKVVRLGDKNFFNVIMGQSPPSQTYNSNKEGLPFLQGKADFGEIYPSPKIYCSKPIKVAIKDDVLLSVRAPVGDVNLAPFKCCIGRGLAAIRTNKEKVEPLFLFYFLRFRHKSFVSLSTGSTFKAIKKETIENFSLPLPPLSEQKKIVEILMEVDKKLEMERKRKEKLEKLKKGLMEDLLTGKRRVRV